MKTIAVLTDFSESATHAAQFAMHMARKMKAKILLFSVSAVPAAKKLALAGAPGLPTESGNELADFAHRMELDFKQRSFPGSFLPEVAFNDEGPEIVDVMTAIMQYSEIDLIITSPNQNSDLVTYLVSDACNRIIDWATVPVLVVPECAALKNFEKIAFASQLHEEDINSVAALGSLMESFAAELMVAHLNEAPSNIGNREAEQQLNRDLYQKLNCGGVYFRSIPDTVKQKNWDWLKANKRTDLLAVVQQSREQMARFFKRGQNLYANYHLTIPVIILPKRP
jgi:hypothetical protein